VLRRSDPFRNLSATTGPRSTGTPTRDERDAALAQMSGRYLYFRPGDAPSLEFERLDP
jgi:hypothetical protein